jgi:hypothetical protein
MDWFKSALLESTIIQGTVTLILIASIVYLAVTGQTIPEVLVNAVMIVIGFWFGSKGLQAARSGSV